MSCLHEQTTLNDNLIQDDCLSPPVAGELEKSGSDVQSVGSAEAAAAVEDVLPFRLRLRNGLRSQSDPKNAKPINGLTGGDLKKLRNSLFDQLIKEAKTRPATDFELCNSFFEGGGALASTADESHEDDSQLGADSSRKVNRRKNQLELLDDYEEPAESNSQSAMKESPANGLSASNSRRPPPNQPEDSSLKELRNFKNLKNGNPNGLIKSGKVSGKLSRNLSKPSRLPVKPAQRIFINDNLFKYNDGLVRAERTSRSPEPQSAAYLKKNDQNYAFEGAEKCRSEATNSETEPPGRLNNQSNRFKSSSSTRRSYLSISNQRNRTDRTDSSSTLNNLNQELISSCLFRSTNDSPVFDFYTFQDRISSDLEQDDCQTSIVALVQVEQISIWTKLPSQAEWTPHYFRLEGNQQVFRCTKVDKPNYVCVLFLVCSFSLVSLKYCIVDKRTKCTRLVHGETFELSNTELNLIQLCFMNPNSIALSIPRINEDIIDVLVYDQVDFEGEFNKSKRIAYMLNNVNNKFSSWNNCFLVSDELDNTFLAIFNQKLYVCNVTEYNKMPKMISLQKYANLEYSYFDVLFDKGVFYLFAGNMFMNYVRIIALNTDRCLAEKLMKYDIEKALEEDRLNDEMEHDELDDSEEEPAYDLLTDESSVRLFKRKGDHLLVVKSDSTVGLYNLFSDEIVYQTRLTDIGETAIAVLNQRTTILAVANNQIIVDL